MVMASNIRVLPLLRRRDEAGLAAFDVAAARLLLLDQMGLMWAKEGSHALVCDNCCSSEWRLRDSSDEHGDSCSVSTDTRLVLVHVGPTTTICW